MSRASYVSSLRDRWIPEMRARGWHAELVDPDGLAPILLVDHDERFLRVPLTAFGDPHVSQTTVDAVLSAWVDQVPVSDPEAAQQAVPVLDGSTDVRLRWRLSVHRGLRWSNWSPGPLTTAAIETSLWRKARERAARQEVRFEANRGVALLWSESGAAVSALAWPSRFGLDGHSALVGGNEVVYVGDHVLLSRLRESEMPEAVLLGTRAVRGLAHRLAELAGRPGRSG
ncbi:hypothetical protein JOF53_000030 [Crossiella equi]|uniref:Uncharacterized protein n=1 Tax=Crossiella equi TaxID=130796 RepID=A0ABS5A3J4_9PSEU|nr:hypothetical protein [Crossiella equi]MBP2471158.1 hypothetical protein [Crossiella equi]